MSSSILVAALSGLVTLAVAVIAFSYQKIVKDLEAQIERNQRTVQVVQDQMERVLTQLASEQDVSNALRNQVRAMTTQLDSLRFENERFKRTITSLQEVADGLRADLTAAGVHLPNGPAVGPAVTDAAERGAR
jgi:septal ring factor EnvC (AmiA/AmiB activator)